MSVSTGRKTPQTSFSALLNSDIPTLRSFVPGRICLFGEHSDWAGGYRKFDTNFEIGQCIVCGSNQGLYADVQPHPSHLIVNSVNHLNENLGSFKCAMDLNKLKSIAMKGGTFSYVAGVAYQMLLKHQIGGLIVNNFRTTLPLKKGLSSSAAVCVLIARAFNKIYSLKLTIDGEMDFAYLGERTTPSECGRMDQCCAFGARPVAMLFDGDSVSCQELIVGASLHIVMVDLQAQKNTQKILKALNNCYKKNNDQSLISNGVQKLLGEINLDITNRAKKLIADGNIEEVGKLMTEAQSLFDRYAIPACPSELRAPVLHRVLKYAPIQSYIYGGKGIGSQGDGTCQLLCKSVQAQVCF